MEFERSSPATKRDGSLGPRDQMNQITSFIDASNVYGNNEEELNDLRLFQDGKNTMCFTLVIREQEQLCSKSVAFHNLQLIPETYRLKVHAPNKQLAIAMKTTLL